MTESSSSAGRLQRVDDNTSVDEAGTVVCVHCGTAVGDRGDVLGRARWHIDPPAAAGPGIRADASRFVDEPVVLRRAFCPGCLTVLLTEVVAAAVPRLRTKEVLSRD